MKTHYSAQELAAMKLPKLPTTDSAIMRLAKKNLWVCRPKVRGKGVEYAVTSLPKELREAIQAKHLDTALAVAAVPAAHPVERKQAAFRADGAMVKRGLIRRARADAELKDIDRARRDAALVLCQAIESATVLSNCSAKRAMTELAERVLAGIARPELIEASNTTYIKPRKGGQTLESLVSRLQKMYAAYLQGRGEGDAARYLVPSTPAKRGHDPIHIHAFLLHFCRPARPPVSEAWRAAQGWFAAQSLPCPAKDTFYRIEKELPVMIKYRCRMTGGEWRAIKPYIARDVSMFHTNDIWVGDGHSFKAKVQHPIHGQPFIPEVTVVLDWVSRRIVGWSVDLAESTVAVSAAFRHAQQQTRARPLIYYSDNGSGQTGKSIDCPVHGTLARQGIAHETGIPGNPQGRDIIERLWQVTTIPLARTYPTCIWKGSDKEATRKMLVALNKKDGSGERILPTFQQFLDDCERVLGWEGEYNRLHAHRELDDRTPMQEYARRIDPSADGCGPSDEELAVLWMPEVRRTPQRGVISLFSNEYSNRVLVDVLREGEEVRVRYDLHNAERVWVLRMDGTFVCTAGWDAHKRAAFPVPRMDQLREARADGKIKKAEQKIAEAKAELGNVVEGECVPVKTIADFIDINAEPVPAAPQKSYLDFLPEPQQKKKEASYMDTVQWLHGDGPDPREKGSSTEEVAAR